MKQKLTIIALTISPLVFLRALTAAALETLAWRSTNSMSFCSSPLSSTASAGSSAFLGAGAVASTSSYQVKMKKAESKPGTSSSFPEAGSSNFLALLRMLFEASNKKLPSQSWVAA